MKSYPVRHLYSLLALVVFAALFFASKSTFPSSTTDTTSPSFVEVVAQLEVPSQPNPSWKFDITTASADTRVQIPAGLPSNFVIRVIALAGDPESGISSIAIDGSNLEWVCHDDPKSEIEGIFNTVPLDFSAIIPPASAITPLQINIVANPIAQMNCNGGTRIKGHVRLVATNGAGLRTTSGTFSFTYADFNQ